MIGMGAKSITIVRAVTADFFFDCRADGVPSVSRILLPFINISEQGKKIKQENE
jgi:hypothetical protein